jgi:hypothetical protein
MGVISLAEPIYSGLLYFRHQQRGVYLSKLLYLAFYCLSFCAAFVPMSAFGQQSESLSQEPQRFIYWRGAVADGRKPYETELVALLLRLSDEKYGPSQLVVSDRVMSPVRGREKLKLGHEIHFHSAPILYREFDQDISIILPFNILNNLLGYRQAIIRRSDQALFEMASKSPSLLKTMVAGQGQYWPDVRVYEHNGFNVMEAESFDHLFPMLQLKRYDYLPLGIGEVQDAIGVKGDDEYDLILMQNLVLFYPWPVYIMVSKTKPELAERLNHGYQIAQRKGDYQALFDAHFSEIIRRHNHPGTRLILLENPMLTAEQHPAPTLLNRATIVR